MVRVRPGWLLALCALLLAVSAWLPWLTTQADGGGRANAIGGTVGSLVLPPRFGAGQLIVLLAAMLIVAGAMAARELSARLASAAALAISLLVVGLTLWYHHVNVRPPVSAGYGLWVGLGMAIVAVVCSVWTLAAALSPKRQGR
jgi:hypothetical protein